MRVITLIDIDSFYVQVERLLNPDLQSKPCAVVQYNPWKGGGIIALSYEAKSKGVHRGMRGEDAKEVCPDINLISVPETRGKADLSKYREESVKIIKVLNKYCLSLERASIDEAYLDITDNVLQKLNENIALDLKLKGSKDVDIQLADIINEHDLANLCEDTCIAPNKSVISSTELETWLDSCNKDDILDFVYLIYGAIITKEIRNSILTECGFECSAGIAPNKILAKLGCGINKPNKQTIIKVADIQEVYSSVPIAKITGLGGKFGSALREKYGIELMSELAGIPLKRLKQDFGEKSGVWLYDLCRGIENDPIRNRTIPKSIGCSKNFSGKTALVHLDKIRHWFLQLISELLERLTKDRDENNRSPQTLHVGLGQKVAGASSNHVSHQFPFPAHAKDPEKICDICLDSLKKFNRNKESVERWDPPVTNISLSATNFAPCSSANTDLRTFINKEDAPSTSNTQTKKSPEESLECTKEELPEKMKYFDDFMPDNIDQLDQDVFDALPVDIKLEIKGHLSHRAHSKRGEKRKHDQKMSAINKKGRVAKPKEKNRGKSKSKVNKSDSAPKSNILNYLK